MDRWRSERELAAAEWWTLDECMRHLDISARTLRRYRDEGLAVLESRVDGKRVALVKRIEAQRHFRDRRHAQRNTRFQV